MKVEKVLKILKHNLEVLEDRPKCPVVDHDASQGRVWREGYEQAVNNLIQLVDKIIQNGQIKWLAPHDDRVSGYEIFDGPVKPWLKPTLEKSKDDIIDEIVNEELLEETAEALKEYIKHEDVIMSLLEDEEEQEINVEAKTDVETAFGEADYWSEFHKQVEEIDEKYHERLDEVILKFLKSRDLNWLDFRGHSKLEITGKPNNERHIYYRDEKIIVTFQSFHEQDKGIIAEWKIIPLFECDEYSAGGRK